LVRKQPAQQLLRYCRRPLAVQRRCGLVFFISHDHGMLRSGCSRNSCGTERRYAEKSFGPSSILAQFASFTRTATVCQSVTLTRHVIGTGRSRERTHFRINCARSAQEFFASRFPFSLLRRNEGSTSVEHIQRRHPRMYPAPETHVRPSPMTSLPMPNRACSGAAPAP